jgi:hypothetical protein
LLIAPGESVLEAGNAGADENGRIGKTRQQEERKKAAAAQFANVRAALREGHAATILAPNVGIAELGGASDRGPRKRGSRPVSIYLLFGSVSAGPRFCEWRNTNPNFIHEIVAHETHCCRSNV